MVLISTLETPSFQGNDESEGKKIKALLFNFNGVDAQFLASVAAF